ncbi:hypothetical protein CCR75_004902 [Bremia lactucae]|uniref:Uncharacterized protein n=1 Tax=Bremia lactucae TaxID=4779 RepID=A0A976IBQ2_BRELC|nr:hypothetical protein CCR75_004902 [Bremia lactucae]
MTPDKTMRIGKKALHTYDPSQLAKAMESVHADDSGVSTVSTAAKVAKEKDISSSSNCSIFDNFEEGTDSDDELL